MKISEEKVESHILAEQYHLFSDTSVTVCCLTLVNGFNCIGHSACIDIAEFDQDLGEKLARQKAFSKAWSFVAYGVLAGMHEADTEEVITDMSRDKNPGGSQDIPFSI